MAFQEFSRRQQDYYARAAARKLIGPSGHRFAARASGQTPFPRIVIPYMRPRYGTRMIESAQELKFFDLDLDQSPVAVAGNITNSIIHIPQGVTESEQVGRKAVIRKIGWRYHMVCVNLASAGMPGGETYRVILYWDQQANGATATVTGILKSADYQSFNNLSNKGRFKILMDRTHTLNRMSGAGDDTTNNAGEIAANESFFKKCKIPVEYDATAGAITEIRSNNLGVLLLSKYAVGNFQSKIRIRFTD